MQAIEHCAEPCADEYEDCSVDIEDQEFTYGPDESPDDNYEDQDANRPLNDQDTESWHPENTKRKKEKQSHRKMASDSEQEEMINAPGNPGEDYTKIPNAILFCGSSLTDAEFRVWCVLQFFNNDKGSYPGMKTLVSMSGKSERSIQVALKGLKEKGFDKTRRRRYDTTEHFLHMPRHRKLVAFGGNAKNPETQNPAVVKLERCTESSRNDESCGCEHVETKSPSYRNQDTQSRNAEFCISETQDSAPKQDLTENKTSICTVRRTSPTAWCDADSEKKAENSHITAPPTAEQEGMIERIHQLPWPNFRRYYWEKAVREYPLYLIEYGIAVTKNKLHNENVGNPAGFCKRIVKYKFSDPASPMSLMDELQICCPGLDVWTIFQWFRQGYRYANKQPTHADFIMELMKGSIESLAAKDQNFPDDARADDWSFVEQAIIPGGELDQIVAELRATGAVH